MKSSTLATGALGLVGAFGMAGCQHLIPKTHILHIQEDVQICRQTGHHSFSIIDTSVPEHPVLGRMTGTTEAGGRFVFGRVADIEGTTHAGHDMRVDVSGKTCTLYVSLGPDNYNYILNLR